MTKILYMGKPIEQARKSNGRYASGWFGRAMASLGFFAMKWGVAVFLAYVGFLYLDSLKPVPMAEAQSIQVVEAPSPILDRIADCESGIRGKAGTARQFGKSGQVLISLNTNGSYDIGKYQINSVHNAEATSLGFNLMTEEGNYGYAKYLYQNRGTGDWYSSSKCWQK